MLALVLQSLIWAVAVVGLGLIASRVADRHLARKVAGDAEAERRLDAIKDGMRDEYGKALEALPVARIAEVEREIAVLKREVATRLPPSGTQRR